MHPLRALTTVTVTLLVLAVPGLAAAQATRSPAGAPGVPSGPATEAATTANQGLSAEDAALENGAPPPGKPADVALWTSARKANVEVIVVRKRAADLQKRAKVEKLTQRLEQAAARAAPEHARALLQARKGLEGIWNENYAILTRPWPINTIRVCTQPLLIMDSAMRAAAVDPRREGAVSSARPPLKTCVDRATLAIQVMSASNDALAKAIGAADDLLAEAPAAKAH